MRGIHFADVPPGQAKYVTCTRGAVLDVIVDIRVGSPTFGRWEAVRLDDVDRRCVYLAEGLGHGFCALSDDATHDLPLLRDLQPDRRARASTRSTRISVSSGRSTAPILSERDAAAPTLAEALERGMLPDYGVCRDFTQSLRTG